MIGEHVYTILNTPVGYDRYRDNGLDAFETDLTDEELNWAGWPPFNIFLNKDRTHLISGETILPKSIYQDGKLVEIDITPIHFGYGAPMSQLGIPHVATGEVAQRILSRLQELSKPYGTKLEISARHRRHQSQFDGVFQASNFGGMAHTGHPSDFSVMKKEWNIRDVRAPSRLLAPFIEAEPAEACFSRKKACLCRRRRAPGY